MELKKTLARLFHLTEEESQTGIEIIGEEMTGETGFLSYRRRVKVRRGDSAFSVFVKWSDKSRKDLGELQAFSEHFCPRECLFYGCLAPLLERTASQVGLGDLGLPLVHGELVLSTGTLLAMEDLGEAGFQLAPPAMNATEARCVLTSLARVQAAFWLTRARLGGVADALFGPESPFSDALTSLKSSSIDLDAFLTHGLDVFRREFVKHLNCEKRTAIINAYLEDGFLDKARGAISASRAEKEMIGVTHSDLWYNNCMIRRDSSGRPVESRILDWQLFGRGSLVYDLAPLWVSSVDNAIVVEEFLPCVDFYHDSIRSLFESSLSQSEEKFPVPLEKARQQAVESLNFGIAWVIMSADTLADFKTVGNLLNNMADLIEHFKL